MKCKSDYEFRIVGENEWIEIRHKDGSFVSSVCCQECVDELLDVIKKFKEKVNDK